jgi:hypothetical protein
VVSTAAKIMPAKRDNDEDHHPPALVVSKLLTKIAI